jgi:repressor LexA
VSSAITELWKAGLLGIERANYEAGRANRYYYRDITFTPSLRSRFDDIAFELGSERYEQARELAARLDAESRPEAVRLLAELLAEHGREEVVAAVDIVAGRGIRSPTRTPEYVRGILRNWRDEGGAGATVVREVPFLGYVVAGPPALAEEQALGTIQARVPRDARGPLFALQIDGDSMVGAGMHHGDYVIVAGGPDAGARSGDIVLALFNGESTVKRFVRRDGYVALHAENERYEPMRVGPGDELVIQGKVVAVKKPEEGKTGGW